MNETLKIHFQNFAHASPSKTVPASVLFRPVLRFAVTIMDLFVSACHMITNNFINSNLWHFNCTPHTTVQPEIPMNVSFSHYGTGSPVEPTKSSSKWWRLSCRRFPRSLSASRHQSTSLIIHGTWTTSRVGVWHHTHSVTHTEHKKNSAQNRPPGSGTWRTTTGEVINLHKPAHTLGL